MNLRSIPYVDDQRKTGVRRGTPTFRSRACFAGPRGERGDVPGWVLITIMTAGLVAVLWAFAEPYLTDILQRALDAVAP